MAPYRDEDMHRERMWGALRRDGTVVAWGDNEYGQLGDGTRKMRNEPVAVRGLEGDVRVIAAGPSVSYALRSDGSVVGWGLNASPDHVGIAAILDHPVAVRGLERGIVALACGRSTAIALTGDGEVLLWGLVQRRDGSVFFQAPEPVAGLDGRVAAVAAGSSHSLALTVDGRVLGWGDSSLGALGIDPSAVPDSGIVQVVGGDVVVIAAALGASVALTRAGEILRWGLDCRQRHADAQATDARRLRCGHREHRRNRARGGADGPRRRALVA